MIDVVFKYLFCNYEILLRIFLIFYKLINLFDLYRLNKQKKSGILSLKYY